MELNSVQITSYKPTTTEITSSSGPPPLGEIQNGSSSNNNKIVHQPAYNISSCSSNNKDIINVINGNLKYGKKTILSGLNMNVQQGSIYGLLGASGCGKTTILSAIVGLVKLNSGSIHYYGEEMTTQTQSQSNSSNSIRAWRKSIGYMPQELALYKEFDIKNVLYYFGRIYGLSEAEILKQLDFLIKFLHLPKSNTEIRHMSGGEQRRTSFAVAILHSPSLLILDEPTVGVDPILRKHIWEHLIQLTVEQSKTVIITTHYMEEAKHANVVGIMRHGSILAEGPPNSLLRAHGTNSMDDLFLKLSTQDEEQVHQKMATQINATTNKQSPVPTKTTKSSSVKKFRWSSLLSLICPSSDLLNHLHALTTKNFIYIWRQISFIFILLFFPGIQLVLCCWALGGEPYNLAFGVINHELEAFNYTSCDSYVSPVINAADRTSSPPIDNNNDTTNSTISFSEGSSCNQLILSCGLIQALSSSRESTFQLKTFSSDAQALAEVQAGRLWGFMEFPYNFTASTLQKALDGLYAENSTIEGSRIRVELDLSNHYIGNTIQYALYETYQGLIKDTISECEPAYSPGVIDPPIWYDEAIYGKHKPSLTEYMCPGLILIIMFFTSLSITGVNYIVEKREGMLERIIISGVTTTEIILAQLVAYYVIILLQIGICLAVLIGVFHIVIHGPIGGVILLIVLQGSLGMFTGFLLSSVCDEEKVVMQWTAAITIPCLILAGIVWPLAAMPTILRYISYIFIPQTFACESLRSMITRGWGISHPDVWPGFVVSLIWLICLWIASLIFAKRGIYK